MAISSTTKIYPLSEFVRAGSAAQARLLAAVNDARKAAEAARYPFERKWWVCLAFNAGLHYVEWQEATKRLVTREKERYGLERVTLEMTAPVVDTANSNLSRRGAGLEVVPRGTDEEALAQARLAKRVLDFEWRRQDMAQCDAELVPWVTVTGTGVLKTWWDEDALAETSEAGRVHVGAQRTEVISPFEFLPDPMATGMQDMQWCIHVVWRPLSYIRQRWPVTGKDVQALDYNPSTPGAMGKELVQEFVGGDRTRVAACGQGNYVLEFWCRPSKAGVSLGTEDLTLPPEGMRAYVSGETVLEVSEFPYRDPETGEGELPFGIAKLREMPNRFWSRGLVEPFVPINFYTDRIVSAAVTLFKIAGRPPLFAKWGSLPQGKAPIDNEYGQIVEYQTEMPQYGTPPQLPSWVDMLLQFLREIGRDIAWQHEVTGANVPAGVSSGVAIDLLQQADRSRNAPAVQQLDRLYERWGRQQLFMARQFYGEERVVRLPAEQTGDENEDLARPKYEELTIPPQPFSRIAHVEVEARGDVLPARRQAVLDLWDKGILGNPQDPRTRQRALRMLEFGSTADQMAKETREDEAALIEMQQVRAALDELAALKAALGTALPQLGAATGGGPAGVAVPPAGAAEEAVGFQPMISV